MEFILANQVVLVVALFAISEVLALNPKVKSNSVFQLVYAGLKKLKEIVIAPKA